MKPPRAAMLDQARDLALGRMDPAEAKCRRLLGRDPGNLERRLDLGDCLIRKGDLAQARVELEKVLARDPANREGSRMLKHVSAMQGDWTRLKRDMERELGFFSGPLRDFEEACLRLMAGDFARGWELMEARVGVPGLIAPVRQFPQPAWKGEPFPGRTLLLHWEQGFGDTLMFVRYAPMVKALGGTVVVSVQKELADLVATCPGIDRVVADPDPLPPFDLQASLFSLPWVFRTGLDSIPAQIPYLDVPARVPGRQAIVEALAPSEGQLRVGIAWAGSPTHTRDAERSLAPSALAPLAGLPGVAWHSFQMGAAAAPPLPGLVHLGPLFRNFSDTAYALSGMDLVISVDTALVHLAGALGIPALVLVTFAPDFRWMLDRDDSPWYPTLRFYRQPLPGDWSTPIRRMAADLQG